MFRIRRALISVSDKTGIESFAGKLVEMGVQIVSTGGTYKLLSQSGVPVTPVAEVTDFPEMLDGRVKTLHPKIHGGILADRDRPEHMRQLDFQKIGLIDLVVVNLYPFADTISRPGVTREEAIENIDIGGPTMVRAAAKNHAHVAVVVNPSRYRSIIEEMEGSEGGISRETAAVLAAEAFAHTAEYDSMICDYLKAPASDTVAAGGEAPFLPGLVELRYRRAMGLRYGENPHQAAALYQQEPCEAASIATAPQVYGPELSFNNILDGSTAWQLACEFEEPFCAIIKHNNPCGAATGGDAASAYLRALECDPTSAYGSVIAFNRRIDAAAAEAMMGNFIELLVAPGFDAAALEVLSSKKKIRIIEMGPPPSRQSGMDMRFISGGLLVQEYDTDDYDRSKWRSMTPAAPSAAQMDDLDFAWRICKHVKSNAIVLARDGATVGVGAGQMSRVDSARIAVEKAGERAAGSAVASDAFFPFPDAVEVVIEAGAQAIIEPGGSMRDDLTIDLCSERGVPLLFTGVRHFRH